MKKYLKSIESTNKNTKNKYKMVSLSPLRYAGGKSRAVGHILEHFPNNIGNTIVSPFFGGGSFELVLSKELGFKVIGYDIFDILVNYWQFQINDSESLYRELKKLIPDKKNFTKNRHILLNYWNKVKPEDLDYKTRRKVSLTENEKTLLDENLLLRAVYYYYNHQLSYGPMFLGWPSSVYLDQGRYDSILEKVKNFEGGDIQVKCDSFETVIKRHKNDFLFCDPPYYLDGDSKMFKGIYPNSNFAIHHNKFDYILFRNLLKQHKGGFLITYNNCSAVREMYKEYEQYFPSWQYSYGQGETRIGKNRIEKGKLDNIKNSHEIIIVSRPK
ncbi:MAG: DNA adenine methylase [Candidatus Lokiarchaeota archaeon]|nr:DNA adenine methylase [Candidatus Lokiarchaeota archaeon]